MRNYFGLGAFIAASLASPVSMQPIEIINVPEAPTYRRSSTRVKTGNRYPMNGKRECARRVRQAEALAAKRAE